MSCFCHATNDAIAQFAEHLGQHSGAAAGASTTAAVAASASASGSASLAQALPQPGQGTGMRGETIAAELSQWLAQRDLPAPPWTPDPHWLQTPLPQMHMTPHQAVTISVLAQLRAQAQTQLGINLLQPAQATAFARVMTTLKARLAVLAQNPAVAQLSVHHWVKLASLQDAVTRVETAAQSGTFTPNPSQLAALQNPGGQSMAQWEPLVQQLRALAPMIAAHRQLGIPATDTAQLGATLRSLTQLNLPKLSQAESAVMHRLTSAMSASQRLKSALGIDPAQAGYKAAAAAVQVKLHAMLKLVAAQLGVRLQGATPEAALAALQARLPAVPPQPGNLATAHTIKAALESKALAALEWKVPEGGHPAAAGGLPALHFAASLQQTLGIAPVAARPCGTGCDAARLMAAASA